MAKPELGAKRQCHSCGVKFFDLHKDPVVCPKCGAMFQLAPLARATVGASEGESEIEAEKEGAETVSLEEIEASENKVETVDVDDDVEIEDAAEEDDTFLEAEEGEDDDVTGLIDGDIDSDEET